MTEAHFRLSDQEGSRMPPTTNAKIEHFNDLSVKLNLCLVNNSCKYDLPPVSFVIIINHIYGNFKVVRYLTVFSNRKISCYVSLHLSNPDNEQIFQTLKGSILKVIQV